ncbi:MAG: hypothetical protein WED05_12365 [Candidatus Atabeyarchaeum deiterrae]
MSKNTIFRYTEMRKFLNYLRDNFKVTTLGDWDGSNAVIIRHDVDFDLKAAYRFAVLEHECGIPATFLVMTTCHTYNPMSISNRKLLLEISRMNFEIGLHFDPVVYGEIPIDRLNDEADREAKILESIVGKKVRSLSLHNPSLSGKYPTTQGYRNAYDSKIYADDRYISDSCMDFKGKDPYKIVMKAKEHPIQILLHPLHYTDKGSNYLDIFSDFIIEMALEIDAHFRPNSTYRAIAGNRNLLDHVAKKLAGKGEQSEF